MKAEQHIQPQICPKCGKEYKAPPAISREDNRTYICPECGTREALAWLGIDDGEQKKILGIIKQQEGGEHDETSDPE